MHQTFMHSRKCYTQNLEFDLSSKKCFFPHMVYCPSRVFWWQYVQLSWQPFRPGLIHSHFRSVSFSHLLLPILRVFKKLQNLVTTKIWLVNSTISVKPFWLQYSLTWKCQVLVSSSNNCNLVFTAWPSSNNFSYKPCLIVEKRQDYMYYFNFMFII